MSPQGRVLLGRDRELEALCALLDRGVRGEAGVALLVGEPGIGKTRLLEAATEQAIERGFAVGWGRSLELGSAPTYWPWIEALRALHARPALHGEASERLLRFLPEVSQAATASAAETARAAPADAFALCDAVLSYLRAASAREPILLVLDDLHAADASSLQLARFVARSLRGARFALLGSYRDVEARLSPAVDGALAQIARDAEQLHLPRLGADDLQAMVRAELGHDDPEAARMIHEATEGNPLFARELLRLLAARGKAGAGVPAGVRAVIRERLSLLSPATVALLQAAAVVGREFSVSVAATVAGVTPAALQEAALEACGAELLVASGDASMRFSHALVAETLAADLAAKVRMKLHRRAAEALQEASSQGASAAALDAIAHHFRQAGADAAELAVTASARAGAAAYAQLAFADAASSYEHALWSLSLTGGADARRRAELLVAQGEALARAGERGRALAVCTAAADLASDLGDGDLLARAGLALGAETLLGASDPPLVRLLERALARLPQGDSPLRARVMARLASARQPEIDPASPMQQAREAIAMARRVGGEELLLSVLHSALGALVDYAEPEERAARNAEAAQLADAAGDVPRALRARTRLMFDRIELGDLAGFDQALTEYEMRARETGQPRYLWVAKMARSMRANLRGDFAAADALEQEGRTLYEQSRGDGPPCVPGRALSRSMLRDDADAFQAAWEAMKSALPTETVLDRRFLAVVAARRGQLEEAKALLAGVSDDDLQAGNVHGLEVTSDAVWRLRDRQRAAGLYARLLPRAGRPFLITGIGYCVHGVVDHALMRLSALMGEDAACEAHARAALALCRQLEARPIAAVVRRDHAEILLERPGEQAARRARELLEEALAEAQQLGMMDTAAHCTSLLGRAGAGEERGPAAARPGGPDAGTRRATAVGDRVPGDGAAPVSPAPGDRVTIEREGEYWTLRGCGALCRVRDGRGVQMLAALIVQPGRELHVLELSGAHQVVDGGDAGEMLDAQALQAYRERIASLREELDEARAFADPGRIERLEAELDQLRAAVSSAVGLGGKTRRAGSAVERARVNVRRRVALALDHVRKASPELGRHLQAHVRTGVYCAYEP